ncbi:unnamed protein product [Adineta steineri]|uniref:Ig-like domain-containing protein n=1 Tax=Adineta steineri TaxID=433720 RepID=A0A815MPH7_9BILA|nr:unnamed protein product [Adineta steineri]
MQLCGCLPVGNGTRNEDKQANIKQSKKRLSLKNDIPTNSNASIAEIKVRKERTKSNTSTMTESGTKRYTLKKQSSSTSVNKAALVDGRHSKHDVSERRLPTYGNESENEQRNFLKLNKEKRRSVHELQFHQSNFSENKRAKSSPDVNQFIGANTSHETTTCDEIDNPDNSRHKRAAVRRRKRSKSPRKQMPSEILDAIKFELVEPVGLDENQLKDIPYENIKTTSQPFRISLSPHSARRRRSSPFNRAGDVVHNASSNMLPYRTQPAIVSVAQVKSTKIISITRTTENYEPFHSRRFGRMDWFLWYYYYFFTSTFFVTIIANTDYIHTVDAQQDERIRLECTVTSKLDAEEAMWMRIRPPHNPDILTYRDSVVYAPERIQLEQRRLSSSINANGTFIDTYFLTLTLLRPNIDDEGRYVCSRGRTIFAEYDLFIIVPSQFVDDNSYTQQRTIIEGSTLQLSCSANGRPKPFITWSYRTIDGKHISLGDGSGCQDPVCELRLGNYTRYNPTTIECVADNRKSTRISKVFHVDVYYPPKLVPDVQTFIGSNNIDVFLQCASVSNPPAPVIWLDDNKQRIDNSDRYNVKIMHNSSTLSFSIHPQEQSPVVFYCQSNNTVGLDEKLINISDFIQLDTIIIRETTTITPSTSIIDYDKFSLKKQKTLRPSRARSRSSTTPILFPTTTISSTNSLIYSLSNNLLNLILILFVICFV